MGYRAGPAQLRLAGAVMAFLSVTLSAQVTPGQPAAGQTTSTPSAPGQPAPSQPETSDRKQLTPQSTNSAPANGPQMPMEFESHGMEYEALTKNGITVMFAPLPPHIKDYNIVQVTVTNGSLVSWTVKPTDFEVIRQDGTVLQPVSADEVVYSLLQKVSHTDVIKLQLLYEDSIYALTNFRSTNGYEQRREAAMTQFVKPGLKAAMAASAITMVSTKLKPGDSTDGAVFFENRSKDKSIGAGRFIAHTCGEVFEFILYPEIKAR